MSTETPVSKQHPLSVAWEEYQQTAEYQNTRRWAEYVEHAHLTGSLWAVFEAGYKAGVAQGRKAEETL
jgi:DUF2075 family protein